MPIPAVSLSRPLPHPPPPSFFLLDSGGLGLASKTIYPIGVLSTSCVAAVRVYTLELSQLKQKIDIQVGNV